MALTKEDDNNGACCRVYDQANWPVAGVAQNAATIGQIVAAVIPGHRSITKANIVTGGVAGVEVAAGRLIRPKFVSGSPATHNGKVVSAAANTSRYDASLGSPIFAWTNYADDGTIADHVTLL